MAHTEEQRGFIFWLEAELWIEWVGSMEGATGWESDAIREARADNINEYERQEWRRLAATQAFPSMTEDRERRPKQLNVRVSFCWGCEVCRDGKQGLGMQITIEEGDVHDGSEEVGVRKLQSK